MNVLSLFDGMSCGQIALERAGIKVTNYYASEIDKYSIKVTKANYPNTVHIGSVTDINYIDGYICNGLENHYAGNIDILIGGSPCQNFSFAGSRKGMVTKDNIEIVSLEQYLVLKNSGFEFYGQSFLFWEYVRLLKECKPKHFLLENVKMAKKWQDLITSIIGVEPILINSALVSAQNRQRLYWTNIPNITKPEDKNVHLKDILDVDFDFQIFTKKGRLKPDNKKSGCLTGTAHAAGNHSQMDVIVGVGEKIDYTPTGRIDIHCNPSVRRYSVAECARLQTVHEVYLSSVSNSQAYKCLINGWTIDVIVHIFNNIK